MLIVNEMQKINKITRGHSLDAVAPKFYRDRDISAMLALAIACSPINVNPKLMTNPKKKVINLIRPSLVWGRLRAEWMYMITFANKRRKKGWDLYECPKKNNQWKKKTREGQSAKAAEEKRNRATFREKERESINSFSDKVLLVCFSSG